MFSFVLGFIVLMACLYIVVRRQTRDKLPRFVDCFACGKQHLGRGSYQNNNHHKAYCIAPRGWQIPESEVRLRTLRAKWHLLSPADHGAP